MGGEAAAKILAFAREHGVITSADILAPGEQAAQIARVDRAGASSTSTTSCPTTSRCWRSPGRTTRGRLPCAVERGVGCVAATCGADGAVIVDADGAERVPAFEIEVVDTTGCGDAFSAGFLRGLSLGRDRRDARGSAAPPPPWWPRASVPTTATSTSPRPTRSLPRRRPARAAVALWRGGRLARRPPRPVRRPPAPRPVPRALPRWSAHAPRSSAARSICRR